MPGGNRAGPLGMGPMTGRGLGVCGGSQVPGYGMPYGGGRGRGCRRYYRMDRPFRLNRFSAGLQYPEDSGQDEKAALREQADMLQKQMEQVQKRLDELEDS